MCPKQPHVSVIFLPMCQNISVPSGTTVLDAALRAKIDLGHECEGMGTCGTCRVLTDAGSLLRQPRNEIESEIANDRGFTDQERLACQLISEEGLKIEIP